jgi:hypothetical protein
MDTQKFKGDALELKIEAIGNPLFDVLDGALQDFYLNGFECNAFILMLYDEKRIPFWNRITRASFVSFIKETFKNFPFIGTFEVYLFILVAIFGPDAEIEFAIPDPGKLSITVNAVADLEFDFVVREFVDGEYVFYNLVDDDGDQIIFIDVLGINTEYELKLLFAEIMPCGISPDITLGFL